MARVASSMVDTGRVLVYSTENNPILCRVKQILKDAAAEPDELSHLCSALDSPYYHRI
ncbi:hypothetical protein JG687_00006238 [Phytophthora cactorum]|uniref:Uncharacterized protein n=2 Tax=Phytophthora TaxID=4783 RepID=A0A8J5MHV4_9STRA|nr:hypothetical protein JG687_00006238 [Phytophthora cactorum]KAG6970431.1 hypothetical protein JG688_00004857 [Phytophthora aleatoria]